MLWPRCSRFLFNTYQGSAELIMTSCNDHLHSSEGLTEGDPLAMIAYTVGTMPLISSLRIWIGEYRCGMQMMHQPVNSWMLSKTGSHFFLRKAQLFGYFPEPKKWYSIVHINKVADARVRLQMSNPLFLNQSMPL